MPQKSEQNVYLSVRQFTRRTTSVCLPTNKSTNPQICNFHAAANGKFARHYYLNFAHYRCTAAGRARANQRRGEGGDREGGKCRVREEGRGICWRRCHLSLLQTLFADIIYYAAFAPRPPVEEYHLQHLPPLFKPKWLFVEIWLQKGMLRETLIIVFIETLSSN